MAVDEDESVPVTDGLVVRLVDRDTDNEVVKDGDPEVDTVLLPDRDCDTDTVGVFEDR